MHSTTHEALTKYNKYRNLISTDPLNSNVYRHKIQKYTTALQRGGFSVAGFKNGPIPQISADTEDDFDDQYGGLLVNNPLAGLADDPAIRNAIKDEGVRKKMLTTFDAMFDEVKKNIDDRNTSVVDLDAKVQAFERKVGALLNANAVDRTAALDGARAAVVTELNDLYTDFMDLAKSAQGKTSATDGVIDAIESKLATLVGVIAASDAKVDAENAKMTAITTAKGNLTLALKHQKVADDTLTANPSDGSAQQAKTDADQAVQQAEQALAAAMKQ